MAASITFDFNANIARFTAGLDKATAELNKFHGQIDRIARNIRGAFSAVTAGLAAVGGAAGTVSAVKGVIDLADSLNELALRTGTTVEALSSYKLAAEQTGITVETLAAGISKLEVFIGTQAEAARKLGLTAKDPIEAFAQLADVISSIESPVQRAAIAHKVLGKGFAELMPLLLQGGDALREHAESSAGFAKRMAELAGDADLLNDHLAEFKQHLQSIGASISLAVVPGLNNLIRLFKEYGAVAGSFRAIWAAIVPGVTIADMLSPQTELERLQRELKDATRRLQELKAKKVSLFGRLFDTVTDQDIAAAKARVDKAVEALARYQTEAAKRKAEEERRRKAFAIDYAAIFEERKARPPKMPKLPKMESAKQAEDELERLYKNLVDLLDPIERYRKELEIVDRLQEAGRLTPEKAAEARLYWHEQIEAAMGFGKVIDEINKAEQEREERLERLRAELIDTIDPIEKYRRKLEAIDELLRAGKITIDQATEGRFRVHEEIEAAMGFGKELDDIADKSNNLKDIARELGMTFQSALEDAIVAGKSLSDVLRALAQDITRIVMRKVVVEPIASAASNFASNLFSNLFGNLFGGFRQAGGPVMPGRAYVVGERGPELFVPKAAGVVVPNLGQGSRAVVINMTVNTPDAGSFRRSIGQIQAELALAVSGAQRNL